MEITETKLKQLLYKYYLMGKNDAWKIHFDEAIEQELKKLK